MRPQRARSYRPREAVTDEEDDMTRHSNIDVIDRMTKAVFEHDVATLNAVFTDDLVFHVRGPLPEPGDHRGVEGFLSTITGIFERTGGDVKIQQLSCLADDNWATEWEHAELGRNGATLETENAFVYRFRDGRIAEMWMVCAAPAEASAFWD
jgi:ketosteroid isomerase-like protein